MGQRGDTLCFDPQGPAFRVPGHKRLRPPSPLGEGGLREDGERGELAWKEIAWARFAQVMTRCPSIREAAGFASSTRFSLGSMTSIGFGASSNTTPKPPDRLATRFRHSTTISR